MTGSGILITPIGRLQKGGRGDSLHHRVARHRKQQYENGTGSTEDNVRRENLVKNTDIIQWLTLNARQCNT